MGSGYYLIVGTGFGVGLNLNDGQLYWEGDRNWWPCAEDGPSENELRARHPGLNKWAVFRIVLDPV